MRSKTIQRILDNTPKDVKIFVDKYADLVVRINEIITEKGLDKNSPEIKKWLNGKHNLSLRSIAKLEAELGETLLVVPKRNSL